MKLFRHHSREFQREIENSRNAFVLDKRRRFNHTGRNKNEAGIFFYASTEYGAEAYRGSNTELFRYESGEVKLLDLRKAEDRALLSGVITDILKEQEEIRRGIIRDMGMAIERESRKRDKRRLEKIVNEIRDIILTEENVVKDNKRISGFTYWGQDATDYERGVILKKEAEELGYDGFIFQDVIDVVEIGLFKPAKLIG